MEPLIFPVWNRARNDQSWARPLVVTKVKALLLFPVSNLLSQILAPALALG